MAFILIVAAVLAAAVSEGWAEIPRDACASCDSDLETAIPKLAQGKHKVIYFKDPEGNAGCYDDTAEFTPGHTKYTVDKGPKPTYEYEKGEDGCYYGNGPFFQTAFTVTACPDMVVIFECLSKTDTQAGVFILGQKTDCWPAAVEELQAAGVNITAEAFDDCL